MQSADPGVSQEAGSSAKAKALALADAEIGSMEAWLDKSRDAQLTLQKKSPSAPRTPRTTDDEQESKSPSAPAA